MSATEAASDPFEGLPFRALAERMGAAMSPVVQAVSLARAQSQGSRCLGTCERRCDRRVVCASLFALRPMARLYPRPCKCQGNEWSCRLYRLQWCAMHSFKTILDWHYSCHRHYCCQGVRRGCAAVGE